MADSLLKVIFGSLSCIGYVILLASSNAHAQYFACFLVAFGLYVAVGLPLSWLPANAPRYGKRTVANGLQLTIGNSSVSYITIRKISEELN